MAAPSQDLNPNLSEELGKTLDEYWELTVRRRWWLLVPASLVALGAVVLSFALPEMYQSETVILIEHQKVPEHYVVSNVTTDLRNRLQTMTQQILSRTRLLRIIEEQNLYPAARAKLVPEELVDLMRGKIEIELVGGDPRRNELNAFRITFSHQDPRVAQQVTNQLTTLFIEENLKTREQQSLGTTKFLETQLEEARLELQEQEKRLSEFKMRYLGELPEQQQGNLQVLAGLQMQLQNAAAAVNRARQQQVYLESLLSQHTDSLAGTGSSATPTTTAMVENQLARLRNEKAALEARYTPQHPDIRKINQEIAQAEALLAEVTKEPVGTKGNKAGNEDGTAAARTTPAIAQLRGQLEGNQMEIKNLLAAQQRLEQEIWNYQRRLNMTPLREQQFADVIRDYNLSKQNYEELLKKKMESELATSLEQRQQGEQFRILDPPSLPAKPHSPDRRRLNLIGGVLGLGLGVGLAFFAEMRDRSLHTEKQLSRLVPRVLVVGIPSLRTAREERRRWKKRIGEWIAGSLLVLAVVAAELFVYWRG